MTDILIRGMEMPKDCGKCFVGDRAICARDAQESDCENFCDLKQAEQEGRLVVLPCKIGDKVFYRCLNGEIKKGTISMLQQKADGSWKFRVSDRLGVSDWPAEDLGKLWFLTREEAEKAMEVSEDA